MSATGATNILSAVDRHQHARLRRLVAHSFSVKRLREAEPFVQAKIDKYLSAFEGLKGQQIDIFERTYELFLDIVSQLSFGEALDCLEGKNPTAYRDVQASSPWFRPWRGRLLFAICQRRVFKRV